MPAAPKISEKAFSDWAVSIAQLCGWRVAHFGAAMTARGNHVTPVRYNGRGFPDLVMVHPERRLVWFREIKAGARPQRPIDEHQAEWGGWLLDAGANWSVWRSSERADVAASISNGRISL